MNRNRNASCHLALAILVIPCLLLLTATSAGAQSLYDRLGGQEAIECWIDASLRVVLRDDRINDFFAGELNANESQTLRDSLVDFACFATSGPCVYVGRPMGCAHAGLAVDHHSFTAFLEDLEKGAKICRLGNSGWMTDPAYSELNKVLLSLRAPIVQDDPGESVAASDTCPF